MLLINEDALGLRDLNLDYDVGALLRMPDRIAEDVHVQLLDSLRVRQDVLVLRVEVNHNLNRLRVHLLFHHKVYLSDEGLDSDLLYLEHETLTSSVVVQYVIC